MKINYDILQNLLKCNKGMKLIFRDGSNILDVYLFSDIILSLNLNINNIEDNRLIFSDDIDMYYKVKYCKLQVIERNRKKKGNFEVTFVCSPFIYYKTGDEEIVNPSVVHNPSYLIAKPIYKIEAEGLISLIVNGKETKFNIGQELLIDTELELCFREKTKNNIAFEEGWYDYLFLNKGENTIEWKGDLKSLIVIPRWRVY